METILITLFILALLLYFIRVSLLKDKELIALYILLPAVLSYITYPWLIEQNKKYIELLLGNKALMTDFALLTVLEGVVVVGNIFALSQQYFQEKTQKLLVALKYVPTVTPILALIYFELQAFYLIQEYPFEQIAIFFIILSILIFGIAIMGIRWLIQEWEIRLELTFILGLLQIIIGIIIGSFYNSIAATTIIGKEIWKPFVMITIIGGLFVLIGFIYSNYQLKRKSN